jgi:hypothetical protein
MSVVILSRSEVEAKNPSDKTDKSIVLGIFQRSAPQNDSFHLFWNESYEMTPL